MEIAIIAVVAVFLGALIYFNRTSKGFDVNHDGKVDVTDAKVAVQNVVEGVKTTADVNKDGQVDVADVKVVATKAKAGAKKAVSKAKAAVKKPAPKTKKQ